MTTNPEPQPEFAQPLREQDVASDPFKQFERWFADAAAAGARMPEAAAVATATPDGRPSVRMVLVKETAAPGFVFYTNYESRKGVELTENPRAALLFYWDALGRQVRIEGPVAPLTAEQSAAYVRSRPRGSQLSALASPQSQVVAGGREELEERVARLAERVGGGEPPVPAHWGGFRLTPETFEFWQHREDRLHDRLRYVPADAAELGNSADSGDQVGGARWRIERLAP